MDIQVLLTLKLNRVVHIRMKVWSGKLKATVRKLNNKAGK